MRNGVKEAVLLLVAADFAYQKNRVQHQPGNDDSKKDDPENQRHHLPPVQYNPADVEGDS